MKGNSHRLALRAVPLALVAVAAAHATATFSAPSTTSVTTGCTGASVASPLGGTVTSSGLGLSLYGGGAMTYTPTNGNESCTLLMRWMGTVSGTFYGPTATIGSAFTAASAGGYLTGWTLTVFINGAQRAIYNCTSTLVPDLRLGARNVSGSPTCVGTSNTIPTQTFSIPSGSLSNYEVDLAVIALWPNGVSSTLSVNVPSGSSIDILSVATPASAVPAMTPLALAMTGILLLSLAGFGLLRRDAAGSGPGRPV